MPLPPSPASVRSILSQCLFVCCLYNYYYTITAFCSYIPGTNSRSRTASSISFVSGARAAPFEASTRTVIYPRLHESHPIRTTDRFHINNGAFLSHDDAAAPHQVAHRGVRRRHPRPPITRRSSEPPRRLRRSARLARTARLEDPERLRRDLSLTRRLAGALRRRRLVGARTLARRRQLADHALGRHAAVRVEDDSLGFQ